MTRSAEALKFRRLAFVYGAKADHWASVNEETNPWWCGNLRLYQNRMIEADVARSMVIRDYLIERQAR